MNRCVVIAPSHADIDFRVLRSISLLEEKDWEIDVIWDGDYSGHERKSGTNQQATRNHYVRAKASRLPVLGPLRRLDSATADFTADLGPHDIVYIHASGVEGMWLARLAKRQTPSTKVIFDYHDSLPFEYYYQLSKRHLGAIYQSTWPVYKILLRQLAKHIDGLVSISNEQAVQFEQITKRAILTAVVPNFRHFTSCPDIRSSPNDEKELSIVWIGQVMQGRDLQRVASLVAGLPAPWRLHVFGNVIDESAREEVMTICGNNCTFYGAFRGDAELMAIMPARAIAVFLGWSDPIKSHINQIASPNKFYAYANLELPIIVCDKLTVIARDVNKFKAGVTISENDRFEDMVAALDRDYDSYSAGATRMKAHFQSIDLGRRVENMLTEVIGVNQVNRPHFSERSP